MKILFGFSVVLLFIIRGFQAAHTEHYSMIQNGDFILQGLFPLTYRDGEKCERVYNDGLMWSLAMVYAVERINNDSFIPGTKVGYKIDNTCFNIPVAMRFAIEIVAVHRPNSACYPQEHYCENKNSGEIKTRQISAVIGPAVSWISIPLSSLLGLYSIPQISYGSTSRILSDKTRYKSFLRTVPSDEFQAQAMADFVRHFEWNYVFLIASDDDYGKMGAAAFKAAAKILNVCIANDQYISFNSDRVSELVTATLANIKELQRAKVIIVFSYLWQGEMLLQEAERLNVSDRTWITSDGWNSGAENINVSNTMLEGIFTFSIRSKRVLEFEKWVKNIRIGDAHRNPWLLTFMEDILKCRRPENNITGPSKKPGSYRVCGIDEKLPRNLSIPNELVSNVIDAVNATANALRDIIDCRRPDCQNVSLPIPPEVLLTRVTNVSFLGADDQPVIFNTNGDRTTSGYQIRNLQMTSSGKLKYHDAGYWALLDKTPDFQINESVIKWNKGLRPLSTCFRICQPGEKIVGQSECCWNCQKCEKGTVSRISGAFSCENCNDTHYANKDRTQCIERKVVFITLEEAAGVSILTFGLVGLVVTSAVAVVFWRLRNTPIVATSGYFLLIVLFFNLYLSFFFGTSFLFGEPTSGLCLLVETLHELLTMLYAAFFIAKTRAANKALKSAVPAIKDMRSNVSEMISFGVLILLEVFLIIIRQITNPSGTRFTNLPDNTRLLECRQEFPVSRIAAVTVPAVVLVLATFLVFRERNEARAFNEPKFISFASIALCILLVAFIPTYRYVVGISRILVVSLMAYVTAFSCMGCIFMPKLYVIFVRPERNTTENRNGEGDISPRTTSSDGHSPDLRIHSGGTSADPKGVHFTGIPKGKNVNFCVNKGLEIDHVTKTNNHISPHDVYIKGQRTPRKVSGIQMNFDLTPVAESNEESSAPNTPETKSKRVDRESKLNRPEIRLTGDEVSSLNVGYTEDKEEECEIGKVDLNLRPPRAFTVI